jgi:hypothetical protein
MEMPKTCDKCKLRDRNVDAFIPFDKCFWTKRNIDPWTFGRKDGYPDDCPLHELPEHGDLIDRNYIQRTLKPYSKEDEQVEVTLGTAKRLIQNAINVPVVVPAERKKEDG